MGDWDGRRVFVTGGEGFIGSHLVERLLRHGAEVRALVHYSPSGRVGWLEALQDDVDIVQGDVRDGSRVRRVIEGREVVFHLAASIGIPYSYDAPESYVQTNIVGTQNVLDACRGAGVDRLVHTSTSEVYGTAQYVPIDEAHPLQPQSPYSASKIGADMMALSHYHAFELPVAIVRPFNTYGPRQSTRAVIPTILAQLIGGVDKLHLGSTSPTRVAASDQALGNVVNVGSGREISIGDLVKLLISIVGRDVEVVTDEERLRPTGSEVERLLCDNTRAREWAGWKPEVSLEEGLKRTAGWVEGNLSSLRVRGYHV